MKDKLQRFFPPGIDARSEFVYFCSVLLAQAFIQAAGFFISYSSAKSAMYITLYNGRRVEDPDAVFESFSAMLGAGRWMLVLAGAYFAYVLVKLVSYHYLGGSRAAYTMRRLPRRGEYLIRCGSVPLAGLIASQIVWRALTLLSGLIYVNATPEKWLPAGSWESVIHIITH